MTRCRPVSEVPQSLLISGGLVVDPSSGASAVKDVLIEDGVIRAVERGISQTRAAARFDASGLVVCPGFVELHSHLREPGGTESETIQSGTRSAAAGGYTTVLCMPNTTPVCDSPIVVRSVLDRALETGCVRVLPVAAITRGQLGEQLAELGALREAGAIAFSDDGRPVSSAQVMRRAMQYAAMLDVPLFDHAEDLSLTDNGVMHEGAASLRLGLRGIPRTSEATIVARDAALALDTGARLHICHVSVRESVEAIRHFKARGARLTAEASPHHLTLTDEAVAGEGGYRTNFKMKPPLCEESDRLALVEGVEDGTIDCIATDHAPHSPASKDTLFDAAPFGIIGFESAFAVLHRAFVEPGRWTLEFLIERMTVAPARILGRPWGTLSAGSAADVAILSIGPRWTFDLGRVRSKSRNSPWLGSEFSARVVATLAEGRVAFAETTGVLDGLGGASVSGGAGG